MPYTPIVGTLGYVLDVERREVLLVHRSARPEDDHFGKYNGLGGKMRSDEGVVTCMRREIREESGLAVEAMQLRGTVNWTGFGPRGEDWLGFIFLIDRFRGTPYEQNEEGTLAWHPVDGVLALPMWAGDRHFLPLVFDGDARPFHGYMPYVNDAPQDWTYVRM